MKLNINIRPWLGYIGLFIGILGIFFSVYTYWATRSYREPVFVVDPSRTIILSSDSISKAPIRVLKSNGEEIKSDLSTIRFFFWNNGTLAIKKDNVLQDIVISLNDPNSEIIDHKILKTSREITKCDLIPVHGTNKELKINFSILEKYDGLSGQIIYEGPKNVELKISGIIEGVSKILTNPSYEKKKFWFEYPKKLLICLFVILAFGIPVVIDMVGKKIQSIALKKIFSLLGTSLAIFIAAFVVFIIIYALTFDPISKAKKETRKNIVQYVPNSISTDIK